MNKQDQIMRHITKAMFWCYARASMGVVAGSVIAFNHYALGILLLAASWQAGNYAHSNKREAVKIAMQNQ